MPDAIDKMVGVMVESVRKDVPDYHYQFADSTSIARKFTKGSADGIASMSRWLARIPFRSYPGGISAKVAGNGAALPTGNASQYDYMYAGYIQMFTGFKFIDEALDISKNSATVIANVIAKEIAGANKKHYNLHTEIAFHGDGTGVLTDGCSAFTTSTMTWAASSTIGISKLVEGMAVQVWDSALTTKRSTSVTNLVITSINYNTRTVTFNGTIAAGATGDRLVVNGIDAYGPSTPVTAQSGYPGSIPVTAAAGIGGDSYRHGFTYANDSSTSNYFLGKLKSSFPQLVPSFINANSAPWSEFHTLAIKDSIAMKRGVETAAALEGIISPAQRTAAFGKTMTINNKIFTGSTPGRNTDPLPTNTSLSDTLEYGTVVHHISRFQDRSRVDYLDPKNQCESTVVPLETYKNPSSGSYFFEDRNGDGQVITSRSMWVRDSKDTIFLDPGAGGFISNLPLPEIYATF